MQGAQALKNIDTTGSEAPRARSAIPFLRDVLAALAAESPADPLGEMAPASADEAKSAHKAGSARLGDVVDRLDERAFGMMLLLLALPCCLPFVYVLPQIVALPMLALSAQLAAGRRDPWLPAALADRRFDPATFIGVLDRGEKYVGWVEAIARPRFRLAASGVGARLVGVALLLPCASILTPLPGTNTVPGFGVAIASLGLIERDGVLTWLGVFIAASWVVILLVFGLEAATLIKDWIQGLF